MSSSRTPPPLAMRLSLPVWTPTRKSGRPFLCFLLELARNTRFTSTQPLYSSVVGAHCKILVNKLSECVRNNACKNLGWLPRLYSWAYTNYICSLLCIHSETTTKNSLVLLCKYKHLFFARAKQYTLTHTHLFSFCKPGGKEQPWPCGVLKWWSRYLFLDDSTSH